MCVFVILLYYKVDNGAQQITCEGNKLHKTINLLSVVCQCETLSLILRGEHI